MSIWKKLAWSNGSIAAALSMQAFGAFGAYFYMNHLKLDPALYALGMTLYAIWNAINDPLLGQLSDRTRTRWGRRVPYMVAGTIPLGIAFALVWMPPAAVLSSQGWLFAYFLGIVCLFDGLYTLVILNWTALFPEMYPSLRERAQMAVIRQVFGIIGLVIGIAVPPMLYGPDGGTATGWAFMGILLAAVTVITLFISVLGSKERPEFSHDEPLNLWQSLGNTLANRSFVSFGLANMALNFGFNMLVAGFPFYSHYVLKTQGVQETILLGLIFVSALVVMPLWQKCIVRFGSRNCIAAAFVMFGVATMPYMTASGFKSGALISLFLGLGLSGLLLITDVLLADIVDEDELRTGTRREGMYFGINGFFIRISIAGQASVLALVLKSSGFDPDLSVQGARAIQGLRFLLSPVVMVALLLALLMMWVYPLHGQRLDRVKKEIEALHHDKASRIGSNG